VSSIENGYLQAEYATIYEKNTNETQVQVLQNADVIS